VADRELVNDGGALLLHLDSTDYFGVNATGAIIWRLVAQPISFSALVDAVGEYLTERPANLDADVRSFVEELAVRKLVVVESGDRAS
jgi:coenzyme PQQ synthesis protein D (PqqD)